MLSDATGKTRTYSPKVISSSECSYLRHILGFIRFHGKRHPKEMGTEEIRGVQVGHVQEREGCRPAWTNRARPVRLPLRHPCGKSLGVRDRRRDTPCDVLSQNIGVPYDQRARGKVVGSFVRHRALRCRTVVVFAPDFDGEGDKLIRETESLW